MSWSSEGGAETLSQRIASIFCWIFRPHTNDFFFLFICFCWVFFSQLACTDVPSCVLINVHGPSRGYNNACTLGNGMHRFTFPVVSSAAFSLHSVCGRRGLQSSIHKQRLVFLTLCTDFLSYLLYFHSVLVRPACFGGLVRGCSHVRLQSILKSHSWTAWAKMEIFIQSEMKASWLEHVTVAQCCRVLY